MPNPLVIARRRRRVLLVIIALLVVAVGGVGVTAWHWSFRRTPGEVILTATLLMVFSLTAAAGLAMWRRRGGGFILGLSILSSAAAFAAWMAIIWGIGLGPLVITQPRAIAATVFSVVVAHYSLLGLARLRRRWEWVRLVTRVCAGLLFVADIAAVEAHITDRLVLPGFIILLIGVVSGTLCVILLHWVESVYTQEGLTTPMVVALTCPRCGASQELLAGRSRCAECGLSLRIEIDEEYCEKCGYLLYGLTSNRCPECGTPIARAGVQATSREDAGERGG